MLKLESKNKLTALTVMKIKRLLIFTLGLLLIVIFSINFTYAQQNNAPQPMMQQTNVVPPGVQQGNSIKRPINNTCPTNNCQPPPANRPQQNNNFTGNQSGSMRPGQQTPPPNMAEGPLNILIILDSSYSMEDRIGNQRKIDIAKRVIYNTVNTIPPDTRLGLRVYGHKIGFMAFNPCSQTQLLVPIQFNSGGAILGKLKNIQPTGQTPITYSIKTALANDFNGLNGPKRIILVSDGMETCDGNPCDFAVEMVRRGIDLKIDVVGFDLKDPAAINQLRCVSLSTGGKFYTADTEADLARSLQQSLTAKKEVHGQIILNK